MGGGRQALTTERTISTLRRVKAVARWNPDGRFDRTHVAYDAGEEASVESLTVLDDASRAIVAENDSPDVGFSHSVNPYRGCAHGCAYCYARPTHEYLGLGAGTDFERTIVVKRRAPELLREALRREDRRGERTWDGGVLVFSGVTDCYQPLERKLELTRRCLEVCLEEDNPVAIITKSPLVERDLDLLSALARGPGCRVSVSLPFADDAKARAFEPFVTTPKRRLDTVRRLADAGVPVGLSVSPLVPGLSEEDLPDVLGRGREAGASFAFAVLLRLPGAVAEVFERRLREAFPGHAEKVLARLREAHGGALYRGRFGTRGRGEGAYADTLHALFEATARRHGLAPQGDAEGTLLPPRPPRRRQLALFDG